MVFPVLPGQSQSLTDFASKLMNERKAEYVASQTSVNKESWWLQPTPMGDICIVHFEAEDPMAVFSALGTSQEPFDVWFRQEVLANTGVNLAQPPAGMPAQIFNWSRGS